MAFTTLQSRLFFPLGQLLNVQVEIQGALALFDRIFEYLDLEPEILDAPDAVDARAAATVAGRASGSGTSRFRYRRAARGRAATTRPPRSDVPRRRPPRTGRRPPSVAETAADARR